MRDYTCKFTAIKLPNVDYHYPNHLPASISDKFNAADLEERRDITRAFT